MVEKKTITLGFLIIIILSGIVYVNLSDNVKIRVDKDSTTFYIKDVRWLVSGKEYSSLWDGTSKMNRDLSKTFVENFIDEEYNTITITRNTQYIRGPLIKDTYFFDGNKEDVTLFPIYHTIEIFNATGYIYQYEVKDITYTGKTKDLTDVNYFSFGKNMSLEWDEGNYYAKVFQQKVASDKIIIKYRVTKDYVKLKIRLFDPPKDYMVEYCDKVITGEREVKKERQVSYENKSIPVYKTLPDYRNYTACNKSITRKDYDFMNGTLYCKEYSINYSLKILDHYEFTPIYITEVYYEKEPVYGCIPNGDVKIGSKMYVEDLYNCRICKETNRVVCKEDKDIYGGGGDSEVENYCQCTPAENCYEEEIPTHTKLSEFVGT